MNRSADRPPIARFLLLFAALLSVALGLAALSPAAAPATNGAPALVVDDGLAGYDATRQPAPVGRGP